MKANNGHSENCGDQGFTLAELLVVIATIALLAAMVLPALAGGKPNNQAAQCVNNLRWLTTAWSMFPGDNSDSIMPNPGWVGGLMNWTPSSASDPTPLTDPTQSVIANYVKSAALFKCPADKYQSPIQSAPRVRSVSMNGAMAGTGGSGPSVKGTAPGGGIYYGAGGPVRQMSQLIKPGPAQTFLFLDEHPDSINDATFMHDPGYGFGSEHWRDLPASYHNGGVGISYADGRAEIHQWKERTDPVNKTIYPVTFGIPPTPGPRAPWVIFSMSSKDYKWLTDHMPYR